MNVTIKTRQSSLTCVFICRLPLFSYDICLVGFQNQENDWIISEWTVSEHKKKKIPKIGLSGL